jgi:hypothetical protein
MALRQVHKRSIVALYNGLDEPSKANIAEKRPLVQAWQPITVAQAQTNLVSFTLEMGDYSAYTRMSTTRVRAKLRDQPGYHNI